ncbi:MAG: S-adenosyl-l-methionine hydroxide adenosyltransferase family protein [Phycisphaerae bacterium]
MAKSRLVTLMTDFGTRDYYVGAMKGVILRNCPAARIVDICHDLPAQNVVAAAYALAYAVPEYPDETLHVVVVDPGVGTDRRILAARFGEQTVLAPDNGVLSVLKNHLPLREIVSVRNPRYVPPTPKLGTFHGRDIFAPVAAHLLNGVAVAALGPPCDSFSVLDLPEPVSAGGEVTGTVLYADHFGNLVSNIPSDLLTQLAADVTEICVEVSGQHVGRLLPSYGFAPAGEPLAVINSMGLLEVSVNQGSAADRFAAGFGDRVRVTRNR